MDDDAASLRLRICELQQLLRSKEVEVAALRRQQQGRSSKQSKQERRPEQPAAQPQQDAQRDQTRLRYEQWKETYGSLLLEEDDCWSPRDSKSAGRTTSPLLASREGQLTASTARDSPQQPPPQHSSPFSDSDSSSTASSSCSSPNQLLTGDALQATPETAAESVTTTWAPSSTSPQSSLSVAAGSHAQQLHAGFMHQAPLQAALPVAAHARPAGVSRALRAHRRYLSTDSKAQTSRSGTVASGSSSGSSSSSGSTGSSTSSTSSSRSSASSGQHQQHQQQESMDMHQRPLDYPPSQPSPPPLPDIDAAHASAPAPAAAPASWLSKLPYQDLQLLVSFPSPALETGSMPSPLPAPSDYLGTSSDEEDSGSEALDDGSSGRAGGSSVQQSAAYERCEGDASMDSGACFTGFGFMPYVGHRAGPGPHLGPHLAPNIAPALHGPHHTTPPSSLELDREISSPRTWEEAAARASAELLSCGGSQEHLDTSAALLPAITLAAALDSRLGIFPPTLQGAAEREPAGETRLQQQRLIPGRAEEQAAQHQPLNAQLQQGPLAPGVPAGPGAECPAASPSPSPAPASQEPAATEGHSAIDEIVEALVGDVERQTRAAGAPNCPGSTLPGVLSQGAEEGEQGGGQTGTCGSARFSQGDEPEAEAALLLRSGEEVQRLMEQLQEGEGQRQQLTAKLQEGEEQRQRLTAQLQEGQGQRQQLTAKLQEGEEQRQRLTAQLQEGEEQRQRLTAQLQKGEGQQQRLTLQLQEEGEQRQRLTAQLQEGEEERQRLATQLQEGEEQRQRLTVQLQEGEEQRQLLTAQLQEEVKQRQRLTAQLQEGEEERQRLHVSLDERDVQLQQLTAQLEEREAQLLQRSQQHLETVQQLSVRLQEGEAQRQRLLAERAVMTQQLDVQLQQYSLQQVEAAAAAQQLSVRLQEGEARQQQLSEQLLGREAEVQRLMQRLAEAGEEVQQLSRQVRERDVKERQLGEQLLGSESTVLQLKGQLQGRDEELQRRAKELQELQGACQPTTSESKQQQQQDNHELVRRLEVQERRCCELEAQLRLQRELNSQLQQQQQQQQRQRPDMRPLKLGDLLKEGGAAAGAGVQLELPCAASADSELCDSPVAGRDRSGRFRAGAVTARERGADAEGELLPSILGHSYRQLPTTFLTPPQFHTPLGRTAGSYLRNSLQRSKEWP